MAHYAKISDQNIVEQVIVVSNEDELKDGIESEEQGIAFCQSLFGKNTKWKKTSYNGKIRGNYAGIGYSYDPAKDVFVTSNREYMIFSVTEIDKIDFSQVLETGPDTLRKNVDETKTFVKWNGSIPSSVEALETKEGPYSYEEILVILSGPDWTAPMPTPEMR
jgi:hypothetical protein